MHFNWLMLIGAHLEGCFDLLTRTEVVGGGGNVHSELVLSVLMLLLNWNERTFFWIALFKPVWDENDKR